jgi:hypothetical protein
MGMVLSFLGGAAKQLTTDIEQAEQNAREDAKLGISVMKKTLKPIVNSLARWTKTSCGSRQTMQAQHLNRSLHW